MFSKDVFLPTEGEVISYIPLEIGCCVAPYKSARAVAFSISVIRGLVSACLCSLNPAGRAYNGTFLERIYGGLSPNPFAPYKGLTAHFRGCL
jgi:hypothetical protein